MPLYPKLREKSRLKRKGWSSWVRAMVPYLPQESQHCFEKRNGNTGYLCKNVKKAIPEYCGIYEWRAKGTSDDQPNVVVYVGRSSGGQDFGLRERILEYCTNGSHKDQLINDALEKGFELWVRTKRAKSPDDAENKEKELLDKYNYAWNISNNGLRDVLSQ